MKKVIVALTIMFFVNGCGGQKDLPKSPPFTKIAVDFWSSGKYGNVVWKNLDGKEIKFGDLKGKVTFLNFWSSG